MTRSTAYAFSNSSPQAGTQLDALGRYLLPASSAVIGRLGLAPGATCWEVGAGGGAVARWLAGQVGPQGRVVATDIDTTHLSPGPNLEVLRHDVVADEPLAGPFDLIHASLVLLHLPQRRRVLADLAGRLTVGGVLVLEEFDCTRPLRVLRTPGPDQAELFTRVIGALLDTLVAAGADMGWAWDVHEAMAGQGLSELDTTLYSRSWTGGDHGTLLHDVNSRQKEADLLARGLTLAELERFRALMHAPGFAAMAYPFVSTTGRRTG